MEILNLTQGTPEWNATRMQHFCASEAPAMLGLSKYQTRTALLAMKKSGIAPDVDAGTQALFDRGHAAEALARPIAEKIIGEELYPCTGRAEVEGLPMLSSFDGLTMDEATDFEHKLFAQWLADYLVEHNDLPDTHWPQVEHQFIVSGASRCLFMVSDGTDENCIWIWYESKPARRAAVLAGWHQFAKDLETFEVQAPQASTAPAPVESLPSVFVQVTGSLSITDNLQKFGDALRAFVERTPTKPETDEEFATCEAAIKTLSKAEEALDAAESAALAQVACIDDMRTLKATLRELARSNRLALEKLVKAEKEARRLAIVQKAELDLEAFITLFPEAEYMQATAADFGGAIKGLKTMASIQNAVDTELARAKIEATAQREKIRANLITISAEPEYKALFADLRTLVLKDPEFVTLTVKIRIDDHKAAEETRLENERARIRAEEEEKAKRDAEGKAALAIVPGILNKLDDAAASGAMDAGLVAELKETTAALAAEIVIESAADTGARITLGAINSRLSPISITREGLYSLGFQHVDRDRAAYLYRESDFPAICAAIVAHITKIHSLKQAA